MVARIDVERFDQPSALSPVPDKKLRIDPRKSPLVDRDRAIALRDLKVELLHQLGGIGCGRIAGDIIFNHFTQAVYVGPVPEFREVANVESAGTGRKRNELDHLHVDQFGACPKGHYVSRARCVSRHAKRIITRMRIEFTGASSCREHNRFRLNTEELTGHKVKERCSGYGTAGREKACHEHRLSKLDIRSTDNVLPQFPESRRALHADRSRTERYHLDIKFLQPPACVLDLVRREPRSTLVVQKPPCVDHQLEEVIFGTRPGRAAVGGRGEPAHADRPL